MLTSINSPCPPGRISPPARRRRARAPRPRLGARHVRQLQRGRETRAARARDQPQRGRQGALWPRRTSSRSTATALPLEARRPALGRDRRPPGGRAGARRGRRAPHALGLEHAPLRGARATPAGSRLSGYEMLKGLAGVATHEHREWVPDRREHPGLRPDGARGDGGARGGTPARTACCCAATASTPGAATCDEARRHVEVLEFLFEVEGRSRGDGRLKAREPPQGGAMAVVRMPDRSRGSTDAGRRDGLPGRGSASTTSAGSPRTRCADARRPRRCSRPTRRRSTGSRPAAAT